MPRTPRRKLLVEGDEDMRVIPQLVEKNGIVWGEKKEDWIVTVEPSDGIHELLRPRYIETELKASGLDALGILVDADEDCAARWAQIKRHCDPTFPILPEIFPLEGLVLENENGLRLGVWIMPDNHSSGMLETFLNSLIPQDGQQLLDYARQSLVNSRQYDAPWKETHADKALVHTWLAWQDPPGCQLHTAIIANQLQPNTESAKAFMSWFRKLYGL